jgi:hypothetical protein
VSQTTYKNSFFPTGPAEYTTNSEPTPYKGYLIYTRQDTHGVRPGPPYVDLTVYDIVKDDVCVGQYAGLNGAKDQIDKLVQREGA